MSEKFVHDVLNHGEHSVALRVNTFITVDELKHFAYKQWRYLSPWSIRFSYMDTNQVVFIQGDIQLQGLVALVIQMNNEDFYLNVDVIPKHTGCRTSSRCLSRSNSGCSSSSSASTSNSVEFVDGAKDVRIVVDQYKMCTGYKILILKNDKTHFTAKCEEDGCGWRIHFGLVNADISRFVLKYSNVIHSCGVGMRLKSPVVTTKLVKHLIADSIQGDPTLKPKQIMSLFKKTYGSNIKYHHARRGKEAVFEDQYGEDEKSYNDLNWYVKAIKQTNPDSFVKLEVDEESGRFKWIFICFGVCKHSYRYLKPMIYLDATFLNGRFRGTLMDATCVNGNDGFYPYAFSIVLSENKDNWFWFLDNLQQVVDDRSIVFLSDRHEGLQQGIPREFPGSYHSYQVQSPYWKRTIPKEKWENAFLPVCRYVAHSSSIAESFNNWILEFKKLHVMQINSKRRVEGLENFNTRLTPVYEDLLNENINIGRTWTVIESMERLYEVRWQVNGFPCAHACAAIQSTREDINSFFEPYFTTEWYNRTYQEIILPIHNYGKSQSYDPCDRIIVPIPVPPPGRRREQHFKKAWENQKRPMMCTKCFTLGHHDRATFPMP
ncbi:uncharacterized protein LOC113306454 [Papaver somniferum]|uniref:uncharacterized protein LOC113306454 n=1 Tax=Papaver somniferum TaxID=3469 RepID=UPI000E6FBD1C|nr:uncharacterized protein LOC113306454 [Papaver somniferum]